MRYCRLIPHLVIRLAVYASNKPYMVPLLLQDDGCGRRLELYGVIQTVYVYKYASVLLDSATDPRDAFFFASTRSGFIERMTTKYLIRNATVVSMDPTIGNQRNCDVFVDGPITKAVGPGLAEVDGAEVIDGTDAIVCPGFVDTHRHMWQTQLAGLLSNHTLVSSEPGRSRPV